jgi:hypothetical protein
VIFTGTATQNFTWNSSEYMTWSLNEGLLLSANTLYSIDIEMSKSTSKWKTGIPYLNCSNNDYAGGQYYYYIPGKDELVFLYDKDRSERFYDRIFHLDLSITK